MEHALMFPDRRRRGRKKKAEKMAELAMAEALARRHQAKTMSAFDPGEVYFVTGGFISIGEILLLTTTNVQKYVCMMFNCLQKNSLCLCCYCINFHECIS